MSYDPDDDGGAPFGEPDCEADTDNGHLYGYTDEEDGRTQWYYSDGTCDCETP